MFWLPAIVVWLGAALAAQRELTVTGVPAAAPFAVRATADPARLVVEIAIDAGWHAYARDVGGGDPVQLQLTAGSGARPLGAPRLPAAAAGKLRGRVRIVQRLQPGSRGKVLDARLGLTVCDPLQCLEPMEITLRGKVVPVSLLLVVAEADAHARRIESFLVERGFVVQVAKYGEVRAATCDAHDLVIADSKLFGATRGVSGKARAFPKSQTPVVAVGFIGTQLIEAHGLAMTSGYI